MKAHPIYLGGGWIETGKSRAIVNPATGEAFAAMSTGDRARAKEALGHAQRAFPKWRALTAKTRGDHLLRMAAALEARKDEVARTITRENGKPLAQSLGEVAMSVDHLRWFAEEARRSYGRVIPNQIDGKRHLVIKTPVGPVAAISPWNFPLVLAVRKVAPALAAGCPVILKPASQTPLCAVALAECAAAAELPPGVFQLITGPAAELAEEFLTNPICRKITFTGSTEVGRELIKGAAAGIKPLSLELGGHAPFLVFDDADIEQAVNGALIAKFRNTGQSCIAANRLYVQKGIYDRFLQVFVERVRALKTGDGLAPGMDVGPLIDVAGLEKAIAHVEAAKAQGARVLCGGRRVPQTAGFFLEPTVLADVADDALCMQEETFAPVAPVTAFETEEEGVARANKSPYGLAAYVFTRDLDRAFRLMEAVEAGTVAINDPVPSTSQAPFGGMKESGWGRELGAEGLDAFMDVKHVSLGLKI